MRLVALLLLVAAAVAVEFECTHRVDAACTSVFRAPADAQLVGPPGGQPPVYAGAGCYAFSWACAQPLIDNLLIYDRAHNSSATAAAVNNCPLDCHHRPLYGNATMPPDCRVNDAGTATVSLQSRDVFTVRASSDEQSVWLCYDTQPLLAGQFLSMSFSEPDACVLPPPPDPAVPSQCDARSALNQSQLCADGLVAPAQLCTLLTIDRLLNVCRRSHDMQSPFYQLPSSNDDEQLFGANVFTSVRQACAPACDTASIYQSSVHGVRVRVQTSGAVAASVNDPNDPQLQARVLSVWWQSDGELHLVLQTKVHQLYATPAAPQTTQLVMPPGEQLVADGPGGAVRVDSIGACSTTEADRDVVCTQLWQLRTVGAAASERLEGSRTFRVQLMVLRALYAVLSVELQLDVERQHKLDTMQTALRCSIGVQSERDPARAVVLPGEPLLGTVQLAMSDGWASHFELQVDRVLLCRGVHPILAGHEHTSGCLTGGAVKYTTLYARGLQAAPAPADANLSPNFTMLSPTQFRMLAPAATLSKRRSSQQWMLHIEYTAVALDGSSSRRRWGDDGAQGSVFSVGCPWGQCWVDGIGCVTWDACDQPDDNGWWWGWIVVFVLFFVCCGFIALAVFWAWAEPAPGTVQHKEQRSVTTATLEDGRRIRFVEDTSTTSVADRGLLLAPVGGAEDELIL